MKRNNQTKQKKQQQKNKNHLHLWVDLMAAVPTLPILTWAG